MPDNMEFNQVELKYVPNHTCELCGAHVGKALLSGAHIDRAGADVCRDIGWKNQTKSQERQAVHSKKICTRERDHVDTFRIAGSEIDILVHIYSIVSRKDRQKYSIRSHTF
jgi:hypothetical protein